MQNTTVEDSRQTKTDLEKQRKKQKENQVN